jgi:hypothetical protein
MTWEALLPSSNTSSAGTQHADGIYVLLLSPNTNTPHTCCFSPSALPTPVFFTYQHVPHLLPSNTNTLNTGLLPTPTHRSLEGIFRALAGSEVQGVAQGAHDRLRQVSRSRLNNTYINTSLDLGTG